MQLWYYFDKPWNLVFHNLATETQPPTNLRSLLGLGLKFGPSPRFTTHRTTEFDHDLRLQTYFTGAGQQDYNPKMYAPVTFTSKDSMLPKEILHCFDAFQHAIKPLFKKGRCHNNLLPFQKRALYSLQKNPDFVIC
eukprot:7170205-Ditylum_brightwellii.AAC.1